MAPRGSNHDLYYCAHCRTNVGRTTLWRHQQEVYQIQQELLDEAFKASVDPQADSHHDQPTHSPDNMSITMSEAALSSLHLSEVGIDESPPPPLPPAPASLPQPGSHPAAVDNPPGSPPDINMMDDGPPTLATEEIDEEILNLRTARRPPTLEEIYRYARYGFAADDNSNGEEDDSRVNPDDDLLSQPSSRSSGSDDEFDIPPGLDLDDKAEILAANASESKIALDHVRILTNHSPFVRK